MLQLEFGKFLLYVTLMWVGVQDINSFNCRLNRNKNLEPVTVGTKLAEMGCNCHYPKVWGVSRHFSLKIVAIKFLEDFLIEIKVKF